MRRVVSLWLPTWPTDRLRRLPDAPPPGEPLVTVARIGPQRIVQAADAAAQRQGISRGMTATRAQSLAPGLHIREAEPEADAAALERLAAWALRYSPIVAPDPPDGLVLDVTGCAPVHGGEAALLADLRQRMTRAGVAAIAALSTTWAAAWGLAHYGRTAADHDGDGDPEALPLAALRLPAETVRMLQRLGFETVADVRAAPRASLTLRFGRVVVERLDRMAGRLAEPIAAVLPSTMPSARVALLEPLGRDASLAPVLERLAGELCAAMEARGIGARRLDLLLERVDGETVAVRVGAARPTVDARHVQRLFADRLGDVDAGFGIEAARLVASWSEPLVHRQQDLAAGAAAVDVAMLADRVANRIGEDRLYRLAPVESDIPERSIRPTQALAPAGAAWPALPRPARLISPPMPIEVTALLPDHPPALVIVNGRRHRVVTADGPERITGEWWRSDAEIALERDYFRVETDDGRRLWVFRATDASDVRWFLHGIFG